MAKTMTATVTRMHGYNFVVESPEAPSHLTPMYLTPQEIGKAKVGDRVQLTYEATRSYGVWRVTEVLPEMGR